ncbi:MAG: RecX family transcriptional regulator [Ileibacterium sp.]|nr:RecX family transcriptional regulator [Ileibacterium sp.]
MRVGLFTDTYLPDINGVVSSTVTLKKALEKAGHTVFVVTNHAGSSIDYEDRVLRLPGLPLKGLYGYKMSSPVNVGAGTYIKNMNLDLIHLQTNFGVGIYGQTLAKNLGIPLVNTYHTMFEDYTHYLNPFDMDGVEKVSKEAIRAASRQICNNVQAVIAPSIKTKEALEEYGVTAPIYVVPTGLNLSAFEHQSDQEDKYKEIRERVSTDPEDIIVVFVGRLAKEKSLDMPIEAFCQLRDPHFKLAVVGSGPDEDYYKDMVKNLDGEEFVHFLGKCAPTEVGFYYGAFDSFVSASLSETQGMTYLEALASELMIFARRDEVVKDLLEEGTTGYYFDDADELKEKLHEFAKLTKEQRAENGRRCALKTAPYTDVTFANTMAAVYDQAILDFSQTYSVNKIKFEDDLVQLTLSRDADKDPIKLRLPLDRYFELKISVNTKLDEYLVKHYLERQKEFEAWMLVKRRLTGRDATKAQVIQYLKYDLYMEDEVAKDMAAQLEERHLIDDWTYACDKSAYWQDMGYSTRDILHKLAKAGIDLDVAERAVKRLPEEKEEANAMDLAVRLMKQIKDKSEWMLRQTVSSRLVSKGYSIETARKASESLEVDSGQDSEALENAYRKALRLYGRLDKDVKERKIRAYLRKNGFNHQEIYELLERSNLDD